MARDAGRADLLSHTAKITLDNRSFPNGAHLAEVEIDPDTGVVTVDRYTVVDDFGNLINPMLVAGQVHGGVAQGIGQALTERCVFDDPMGMKGCGEAGTVGALAAIANAVLDAMWDAGVREVEMPYTPHRVWQVLQDAKGDSAAA